MNEHNAARWTLVATSFGLGMALLDVTAVNVAVPAIRESLHTDVRGLSWVIDGYTLTFASLLLLAGGFGDRLGARRIFVTGLAIFTFASLLCGLAPGAAALVLARILQGVGAALFMPSSLAILRQSYPDEKARAKAIGIWSALTAVAGATGPLFGGLLVTHLGWRSIFFLNVPIGLVAIAMAFRYVKATQASAMGGLDLPAQLTAAASLALFTWALIERSARGWGSPVIWIAFVLAIAGMRAFVYLEKRSARPILPFELFQNRTFAATASAALVYAGAFFGTLLVFSLYFQGVRGEAPATAGLHIATVTSSFGLTSILAGRIAAKYGTRTPILFGLVALTLSALSAAALNPGVPFFMLAPALVLMGFGAGLVAPSLNMAILSSVPPQLSGIGAGVLNASRQIGTALGVAIFASQIQGEAQASAVRVALLWAAVAYAASFALSLRASIGGQAVSGVAKAGAVASIIEPVH